MNTRFANTPGIKPRGGLNKWLTCALIGILGLGALALIGGGIAYYYYVDTPTAGGPDLQPASVPAVTILEPANGTRANKGDSLILLASATDPSGVIRLDLWVDDVLILSQSTPDANGLPTLTLTYPLVATKAGTYHLIARAFNSQGDMGESVVHYVTVEEPVASTQKYAQYVVQEGDTLENIAQRLGVSVEDILRANPQLGGGQIQPGQVIIVPIPQQQPAPAAVPGPNGVQPVGAPGQGPAQQPNPANPPNNPPNPPAPVNQPSLSIKGYGVVTSPVFYGFCTTEPQSTDVVATIEPPGAVQTAAVKYQYSGNAAPSPIFSVPMAGTGGSNYKAVIKAGGEAAQYLGQANGLAMVWLEVTDTNSQTTISQPVTLLVNFCPNAAGPAGNLPGNLPGILPQFLPGVPQADPGAAQLEPALFPGNVLPPGFGAVTAPGDFKVSAADGCKVTMTWTDSLNETGYEIYRFDPGNPVSYRVAALKANVTQHTEIVPEAGKYGYKIEAIKDEGNRFRISASSLVWVEVQSASNCKIAAGPKRLFFQPIEFIPNDKSIQKAYVLLTLNGFSPIRVPRSGQDYLPVGAWGAAGEWAIPLPETMLMKPGDRLVLEVRAARETADGPKDMRGFRTTHTYESLIDPAAYNTIWNGQDMDAEFALNYRLWMESWQWGGQVSNPALPAPTNLKLAADPFKHNLTWDYDAAVKPKIDGFTVYAKYSCPSGIQEAHHVITKNVSAQNSTADQRLTLETVKQPAGCTCQYQVSAWNHDGESKLSDPASGDCKTGAPEARLQVHFEKLQIDQDPAAQYHFVDQSGILVLFAGESSRTSGNFYFAAGKTYYLQSIYFGGTANSNRFIIPAKASEGNGRTVYKTRLGFFIEPSICSVGQQTIELDQSVAQSGEEIPFWLTGSCGTGCTCKVGGWINALQSGQNVVYKNLGQSCSKDAECDSGKCNSNVCMPASQGWDGATCFANSQCASGTCQCFAADRYGSGQFSYPCPTTFIEGTLGVCVGPNKDKLANGAKCSGSSVCASGYCANGLCAPKDGLGQVGDYCHHTNHCANHYCKCPYGYDGDFCRGYENFTEKPGAHGTCGERLGNVDGGFCREDYECQSGNCEKNKCVPIDGTGLFGEYCFADNQCYSNRCTCPDGTTMGRGLFGEIIPCTGYDNFTSDYHGTCQ